MAQQQASINWLGLWFVIFLALKLAGQAYIATWSWWWVLLPVVPLIAGLFHAMGAV